MSRCTDRNFEKMLYAYELNLLSDQDQSQLEVHLIECQSCFQKALKFEKASRLISHDTDIQDEVLKEAVVGSIERDEPAIYGLLNRLFPRKLIPIYGTVMILILFLILKPWYIHIEPTKEAYAAENRLAIMYFENLVDKDDSNRLGEIAANLLITDLAESRDINVISSQRLFDVLKNIGLEEKTCIDRDCATEIAYQTNSRWILLGSILQTDPGIVITTHLIDVERDEVESSEKITGEPGEDIFSVVDRLSSAIRNDLSLPIKTEADQDRSVSEITTGSPEAYRYYLEGIDFYYRLYFDDAIISFRKALEYDSTFAMPYYYLSSWMAGGENREMIKMALLYSEKTGKKDRLYIKSRAAELNGDINTAVNELEILIDEFPDEKMAYFALADLESRRNHLRKATEYYNKTLDLDPDYGPSYNGLAYIYFNFGDMEGANWAINKYIELAPEDANPYDTRGEFFIRKGKSDSALAYYLKAISIKPDFYGSYYSLAQINLNQGNYDQAEKYISFLKDARGLWTSLDGYLGKTNILMHQGKFEQALKEMDSLIQFRTGSLTGNQVSNLTLLIHYYRSKIYAEMDDYSLAVKEYEKCRNILESGEPDTPKSSYHYYTYLLTRNGKTLEAFRIIDSLSNDTAVFPNQIWNSMGTIMFAENKMDSAIEFFEKDTNNFEFFPNYMRAIAYLEDNRLDTAITLLKYWINANNSAWSRNNVIWDVKLHYYLARAYEKSNWIELAINEYETFLRYWENADCEIKSFNDARERLSRLKNMP